MAGNYLQSTKWHDNAQNFLPPLHFFLLTIIFTVLHANRIDRMISSPNASLSSSISRSQSIGYGLGLGLPDKILSTSRSASLPSPRSSPLVLDTVTINLPGAFDPTSISPADTIEEKRTTVGEFERGLGLIGMGRSGEGMSDSEESYWSDDSDGGIMTTSKGQRRISLRNTWSAGMNGGGSSEASSEEPELSYSPSSSPSSSSSSSSAGLRRTIKRHARTRTGSLSHKGSGDFSHLLQFIDFTPAPLKPTLSLKLKVESTRPTTASPTISVSSPPRTDLFSPISSPISNLDSDFDSPHSSLDSILSAFPSHPIASTSALPPPSDEQPLPMKISVLARTRPVRSDASRERAYTIASQRAAFLGTQSQVVIKLRPRAKKILPSRMTVSSYLPLSALRSAHRSASPPSPTLAEIRASYHSGSTKEDEFINKGKKRVTFFFDPSEKDVRDHLRLIGREEAHENLIDMWNSALLAEPTVEAKKPALTASSFFGSLFGRSAM